VPGLGTCTAGSFAEVGVAMRDCETWDMWRLRDMHDMGHVRLETKQWHWHAGLRA